MYYNNANEIQYDLMEILGQKVLFSCERIDRKSVPEGFFVYDVRHDDECGGTMTEIKPFVLVNHWGTVISKEEIELTDGGCRFIDENKDVNDCNTSCTFSEYKLL